MTTPAEVYPFSTQDGKAIPLDIIKPSLLITKTFSPVSDYIIIPEGAKVATLIASTACLLRFTVDIPTLVDGTAYSDLILIPTDTIVTVALTEGTAYVRSLAADSGTLYIQVIEKWAGLALDRQYTRK